MAPWSRRSRCDHISLIVPRTWFGMLGACLNRFGHPPADIPRCGGRRRPTCALLVPKSILMRLWKALKRFEDCKSEVSKLPTVLVSWHLQDSGHSLHGFLHLSVLIPVVAVPLQWTSEWTLDGASLSRSVPWHPVDSQCWSLRGELCSLQLAPTGTHLMQTRRFTQILLWIWIYLDLFGSI